MSAITDTIPFGLSFRLRPLLENVVGETPDAKITNLLRGTIQSNLEACERDQLELEFKYGLEYEDFKLELESGRLGDEFGFGLEMDAMRWADLVAEKRHWLQQLRALNALSQ
ncbi:MAG: hypothetical protein K1X65_20945 [Caldilineales bacterium]|nr:hypothetical protein [Caldilineales bacterium]MCW5857546.1 hypothetical protein [Caldilineales bacterium]